MQVTMPGSYTQDTCRYSVVNNTVNVSSSWFNTSTYRFTPQKAGYWNIVAGYDVYRGSSSIEANLIIQKNGLNVAISGSLGAITLINSKIIYLNGTTDYISIVNNGGASNSNSRKILFFRQTILASRCQEKLKPLTASAKQGHNECKTDL
jgi:hypothetical protein